MKDKNNSSENLSEQLGEQLGELLGELDGDILSEAYMTDSAEKLNKLKGRKEKKAPALRRIAVVAACLAVAIGLILAVPALLRDDGNEEPSVDDDPYGPHADGDKSNKGELYNPWDDGDETGRVVINSLDKLNYYSAKKIITDAAGSSASTTGAKSLSNLREPRMTLLSNSENDEKGGENIYYYELNKNEVFTVSSATFFRAEIKSKEGFLASKLGVGLVDVVITESDLETMITFKRGENYYSCLLNGWSPNKFDFTTHKYIEGFCIVKNLAQDNFSFEIIFDDDGQVSDVDCRFNETPSPTGTLYPDLIVPVPDSTCTVNETVSFTVSELEEYFNSSMPSESSDEQGSVAEEYVSEGPASEGSDCAEEGGLT